MKVVHQHIAERPARSLFVWFLGLMVVGTLLLMLPISHANDAEALSLSDAAFTATSASCVTGLAVRSTARDFSRVGQLVILSLIQLGGLGIVTVATVFIVDLTGRKTDRQRELISSTLGLPDKADMTQYVNDVVKVTLLFEFLGATVLIARRAFVDSPFEAIWWGVFHSISAFCNAGFALDDASLSQSVSDPVVNLVILTLVLAGGIGYPVIRELIAIFGKRRHRRWALLSFHGKLTLSASLVLVAGGASCFWLLERNNTLNDLSGGAQVCAAVFQGATPRTAGFNTLPINECTNATLVIVMLLMVIGGNSCSTAGGVKVSTIAVQFLDMVAHLRGKEAATVFGHRIPKRLVSQTGAVVLGYTLFATIGVIAIVCIEQSRISHSHSGGIFLDAMFEVISALSTVGLSTGMTPKLSEASRWVIMFLMFSGRIGPLVMAAAISRTRVPMDETLPDATLRIG